MKAIPSLQDASSLLLALCSAARCEVSRRKVGLQLIKYVFSILVTPHVGKGAK